MYRLIALLIALSSILPAHALADNPYDAAQRKLAQKASQLGKKANGMLPLIELYSGRDDASDGLTLKLLEGLYKNRKLSAARRAYVGTLLSRMAVRKGDFKRHDALISELGYITQWQVVGPFDNEGKQGFAKVYGPEAKLSEFDATSSWRGKERDVAWRPYPNEAMFGYVNFDAIFRPQHHVCGYATTQVNSEKKQALLLSVGAGGAIKAWWNGELVHEDAIPRGPLRDRDATYVGAHKGNNRLTIKVCGTDARWGFYARVSASNGQTARGISTSNTIEKAPAGHGATLPPKPFKTPLRALESAANAEKAKASALVDYATFLRYTSSDDPAENYARQFAARAADLDPTVRALTLAADTAERRGDVARYVNKAVELFPKDPQVQLLKARFVGSGYTPEDALPLLRAIKTGVPGMEARSLRADILTSVDMFESAYSLAKETADLAPTSARWNLALASAASNISRPDEALTLKKKVLAYSYDDLGLRRALIAEAVHRKLDDELIVHLEAAQKSAPDSHNNLRYLSRIYEAVHKNDKALEMLDLSQRLAPENAATMVAHGRLLLRLKQPEAASRLLQDALAIRPQDAKTRELLEHIEPRERPDEKYAISSKQFLARRVERAQYPLSTLQDLTVNTVFPNGLGSSFRQFAVQVNDEQGARQMRSYSMQFDPGSQRIDIRLARVYRKNGEILEATQTFEQQLGEPWYRIYYDTRALVVVFPDLEPGDTVELRWRTDDLAHRNLFADYYGDMSFLQSFNPIAHKEYVLIAPKSRTLHFNDPKVAGLKKETTTEGNTNVYRFWADNVAPVRSESGMPGMTEIAPYIHVSTYAKWEEVGVWYWGLIQDQLKADKDLKDTVAKLVKGKKTLPEKVKAIHGWVIDNTRYVGLEFGIHGFKPYRVTQIVKRGFGDCKDKASLLYTMFREAGIDAHVVLVRTRRNGAIKDLPASLAVFDHAIAYVPGLDTYIDGTAEHSGVSELPQMDQGVTVLHVWPEGSELRKTPVLSPDRNKRIRKLNVTLAADGSAKIEGEGEIIGSGAAGFRSTYQAEGTRKERFERSVRNIFPGASLGEPKFSGLSDKNGTIKFSYTAEVPQFGKKDGTQIRVRSSVLSDLVRSMATTPTRQHILDLGGTSAYHEERTVRIPKKGKATLPEGGEARSAFGHVKVTVEKTATGAITTTDFELTKDRVLPTEYKAFRKWAQDADRILKQQITIEGGQS